MSTPSEDIVVGDGDDGWWLLHAAAAQPGALVALARALVTPKRCIRIPTLRPHGDGSVSVAHYAQNARVALDAHHGRTVLFGHSMGGLAALLAVIEGARPDALVLYEPITVSLLDPDDPGDAAAAHWDAEIIDRLAAAVAAGDPESGVAGFVEAWNESPWSALPESTRQALIASAPALAEETRGTSSLKLSRRSIAALSTPTVILNGMRSPEITVRMCKRLHALLPNARLLRIPGVGHMGPVTMPDRVAEPILLELARDASA